MARAIAPVALAYVGLVLWSAPASAADVCPAGRPARSVDVFDGTPDEHMDLMADDGDRNRGSFRVGGIYDRGRFVTVRCIFADAGTLDVELPNRVNVCDYRYDRQRNIRLDCHL